jgi:hypothetical protein
VIEMFREAQSEMKRPGVTGWWELVIPQLEDQQREGLIEAAQDRTISNGAISLVLKRWGYDVSPEKVAYWRRNVAV